MKKGRFVVDLQGVEIPDALYIEIEAKINDVVLTALAKIPDPSKEREQFYIWGRKRDWYGIWLRKFKSFDDFNQNISQIKDITVGNIIKG